jgi:hypothetical protein
MLWQCINEERSKISFMRLTVSIHSYLNNLSLACNLENNNRWNYELRVWCFIFVSNVFGWCVTLDNRVRDICTETGPIEYVHVCHALFLLAAAIGCCHSLRRTRHERWTEDYVPQNGTERQRLLYLRERLPDSTVLPSPGPGWLVEDVA